VEYSLRTNLFTAYAQSSVRPSSVCLPVEQIRRERWRLSFKPVYVGLANEPQLCGGNAVQRRDGMRYSYIGTLWFVAHDGALGFE